MKQPCTFCGKLQDRTYCSRKCLADYNRTVIIGENICRICRGKFPVTKNTRKGTLCKGYGCWSEINKKNGRKKREPDKGAPPHIRRTYCVQFRDGREVRCVTHMETCSENCYREVNGKPVCRVEPEHVARPWNYQSSLAGMSAIVFPR